MRRISLVLLLGGSLVALTGCPPTYPKCNSDENCKEQGEVCVNGQCQECATDANCKDGFVCQDNKCQPKPECSAEQPCAAGNRCDAGKCVPGCDTAADCGTNMACENNQCVREEGTCTTNADCPGGQECQEGRCAVAQKCELQPIRFGFNEASLPQEARDAIAAVADCLKQREGTVTLEGHADERGTEEYNLNLSNKRAAAVKKYLVDLGVPENRIETVGYGENRPAESGSNEDAWAANRRVEIAE